MRYIELNEETVRPLPFYLAMEEWVARHQRECDCFFMWQVEPTVIFGRNQLIQNEVNLDYCRQHHIHTYRRKSGGGCVYADMNNVMFSYVTDSDKVELTFHHYIDQITQMLKAMGVDASTSGRNDVLVDGRKVSGNAFYHSAGRSIVHGTMLYDTDMKNMVGSITPNNQKLVSKGVESVRQRITLLKDYTSMTIDEFKSFARAQMCDEAYTMTPEDVAEVEDIMQEYLTDEFIYGNNPRYSVIRRKRFPGVGDFEVRMEMKNDTIKSINMAGDFFLIGDLDNDILRHLKGRKLTKEEVQGALPEKMGNVIMNMTDEMMLTLLLGD